MIDLDAISERLAVAERNFLDAVERDLTANSSRTAEAVTIAKFYPSVFEDVRALIAEVERTTDMPARAVDYKSAASADFATGAQGTSNASLADTGRGVRGWRQKAVSVAVKLTMKTDKP